MMNLPYSPLPGNENPRLSKGRFSGFLVDNFVVDYTIKTLVPRSAVLQIGVNDYKSLIPPPSVHRYECGHQISHENLRCE